MGRNKKPIVRVIPDEIIRRYSSIKTAKELSELQKTGYLEDLFYSGLMDDRTEGNVREFIKNMGSVHRNKTLHEYFKAIDHYRSIGSDYDIPEQFLHPDWKYIKSNILDELSIKDISIMAMPFTSSGLVDMIRKEACNDIINVILNKSLLFSGYFPEGVYSSDDLATADFSKLIILKISYITYSNAAKTGILPEHHKDYANLWLEYYKKNSISHGKRQNTQEQIAKWNQELEDLWKTGKYSTHIAACRDIADKHIRETGDIITPEHIADETRETYWKLNPKKAKKSAKRKPEK